MCDEKNRFAHNIIYGLPSVGGIKFFNAQSFISKFNGISAFEVLSREEFHLKITRCRGVYFRIGACRKYTLALIS